MSELAPGRPAVDVSSDDDLGALIALAGLPNLTPGRFWSLMELGSPRAAWATVLAGAAPRRGRERDVAASWAAWASHINPAERLRQHRRAGVHVLPYGTDGYPNELVDDPDPPVVIFKQGPQQLDDRIRVAVVGTRKCSNYGRDVARALGAGLAGRGIDVVSGLASGIDAAAHAGAVSSSSAHMVAVVAGGVDVIYPKRNAQLYHQVAQSGALLSEWPLGCRPTTWRFPARNRLVAALAAATVVVESAATGGSLYTVDEALRRDRAVFAVPGPIYSPVSAGTNRLLADGAYALCSVDELLDTLAPQSQRTAVQTELGIESWLLELIGWQPMALDVVVDESGRSPGDVTLEAERLIGRGVLRRTGGVVERVG